MSTTHQRVPRGTRDSKSTLICPDCGHTSDVDGDWLVRQRNDRDVYVCPVCTQVIAERHRDTRIHSGD